MKIDEYRQEIDGIDRELVSLFCRRMELCAEVGRYKRENSLPVYDKGREEEIITRIAALKPEYSTQTKRLYREIFAISRDFQKTIIDD